MIARPVVVPYEPRGPLLGEPVACGPQHDVSTVIRGQSVEDVGDQLDGRVFEVVRVCDRRGRIVEQHGVDADESGHLVLRESRSG